MERRRDISRVTKYMNVQPDSTKYCKLKKERSSLGQNDSKTYCSEKCRKKVGKTRASGLEVDEAEGGWDQS